MLKSADEDEDGPDGASGGGGGRDSQRQQTPHPPMMTPPTPRHHQYHHHHHQHQHKGGPQLQPKKSLQTVGEAYSRYETTKRACWTSKAETTRDAVVDDDRQRQSQEVEDDNDGGGDDDAFILIRLVEWVHNTLANFYEDHKLAVKMASIVALVLAYHAYLGELSTK
jgi:hypothetical protein